MDQNEVVSTGTEDDGDVVVGVSDSENLKREPEGEERWVCVHDVYGCMCVRVHGLRTRVLMKCDGKK